MYYVEFSTLIPIGFVYRAEIALDGKTLHLTDPYKTEKRHYLYEGEYDKSHLFDTLREAQDYLDTVFE